MLLEGRRPPNTKVGERKAKRKIAKQVGRKFNRRSYRRDIATQKKLQAEKEAKKTLFDRIVSHLIRGLRGKRKEVILPSLSRTHLEGWNVPVGRWL